MVDRAGRSRSDPPMVWYWPTRFAVRRASRLVGRRRIEVGGRSAQVGSGGLVKTSTVRSHMPRPVCAVDRTGHGPTEAPVSCPFAAFRRRFPTRTTTLTLLRRPRPWPVSCRSAVAQRPWERPRDGLTREGESPLGDMSTSMWVACRLTIARCKAVAFGGSDSSHIPDLVKDIQNRLLLFVQVIA